MENNDTPKPRRPLPIPNVTPAQRPNTPVAGASPIASTSFYASSSSQQQQQPQAPPLPVRPRNVGSSHTAYIETPPAYTAFTGTHSPGYREPELIAEDLVSAHDHAAIPQQVIPPHWTHDIGPTPYDHDTVYNTPVSNWEHSLEPWVAGASGNGFDAMDYMTSVYSSKSVVIDDRDADEEANWWDASTRAMHNRPGPGMLPPVLADELHNPDHSLFSVSVTSPNVHASMSGHRRQASMEPHFSSSSSSGSIATPPPPATSPPPSQPLPPVPSAPPAPTIPPPTEEDVRQAVPHANAYYCPKENGWVLLSWKSSSVSPPLARSFLNTAHYPLPDQNRRRRTASCIGDGEQPFGPANKTHHFHKYLRAVDAHKLTPPFHRDEWETKENVKAKRRGGTIIMQDCDLQKLGERESERIQEDEAMVVEEEAEGRLLDLYVCCQCSFYCVASGVIPGVIPRKFWDEFIREKRCNPPPGKTGEAATLLALETLIVIIESKLWKGQNRLLRVGRPGFQSKLGWNQNIKRIFECLGFVEETVDNEPTLRAPNTDPEASQGKQNSAKLLRAWVEISSWTVDFQRIYASQFKERKLHPISVKIDSAREMYQTAIGAHPDQIPRGELMDPLMSVLQPLQRAWQSLGLTPMTYSWELLAFGYFAQCRCDPGGTINYFTHFCNIVKIMQDIGGCPQQLQDIVVTERSRDRFTSEDVERAAQILGFGAEGSLKVEYDNDIPEEFIENAWKECVKRSWRDYDDGQGLQRDANEAFRVLAETKGSIRLRRIWEVGKDKLMNPDRAYDILEVPKELDDSMLIPVFSMRLDEQPQQIEKMREALYVIAETRDSERLRQYLSTGQDPGDVIAPIRPDLPRGLNQLGNTCYLNSLLQYFYTIKDLREAVLQMGQFDLKSFDDDKLTDDDLKRHRVGGRLVTRREIVRSKKFIGQLSELFWHLEYSETAAVTPTIELAKLALVTSRDEEEDEADKGGTDSSNDTDATLVDDGPSRFPVSDPPPRSPTSLTWSPTSVLGKRPRDIDPQRNDMDIDSPISESPKDKDGFAMIVSPRRSSSPHPAGEGSSSKLPLASTSTSAVDKDGDIDIPGSPRSQKPPALTQRKATEVSDSIMMFGRQHDVAECMDNCMFQIETALLKFDTMSGSQGDRDNKTSVVKGLFYGKIRQRLSPASDDQRSRASIHDKEDLFSHLPVNVADDGVDIYDGLSGYFDDVVEYEGKKARMEVTLIDLPPLLQIQLQRVQFNRDTLQPYKSQAFVKFGETIYMDRFLASADPQKKAQSKILQTELNACRERVRLLVRGKDGPFAAALENSSNFLAKQESAVLSDVYDELVFQLNEEQALVKAEIDQLRNRADSLKEELETIWRDETNVAYELTSVFVHRGSSPSWGHYFFYSRHLPDAPDSWFKYNDSDVTVVSKDEVLADTTGSTANPYLLVFARKGSEVVDTVKRFDPTALVH